MRCCLLVWFWEVLFVIFLQQSGNAEGQCTTLGIIGCCISAFGVSCNPGGCWCDQVCHDLRDCCSDVEQIFCFPATYAVLAIPGNPPGPIPNSTAGSQGEEYYADEIISFSSELNTSYSSIYAIGAPDQYPSFGHSENHTWASQGQFPEFLEFRYPEALFINKISVYETVCAALTVSQVYVWNPYHQIYVSIYTQNVSCPVEEAGILELEFERLPFSSDQVKVDFDCRPSPYYCSCDSVSVQGISHLCSQAYEDVFLFPKDYLFTQSTASNFGNDILVAPLQSGSLGIEQRVMIGTTRTSAGYLVENATGDILCSGNITASNPGVFTPGFLSAIPVMSSEFSDREKGWYVHSIGQEPISALYISQDRDSFSSYLAYPCVNFEEETYEYFGISVSSGSYASQIVLVACENDTIITVTPTEGVQLPLDAQDPNSRITNITAGDTSHSLTLHFAQTLLISNANAEADLTGTKIISNKPLSVVSGHQCASVPPISISCQQLAVQVPPTFTWGTEFLLTPFDIRSTEQYYRIVAAEDDTAISYKQNNASSFEQIYIPGAGGATTLVTGTGTFYYLTASKPVFVTQLARGGDVITGGDGIGNPAIAIVSPTHMYVKNTTFFTLAKEDFPFNAISVSVKSEDFRPTHIMYNGMPLNCSWYAIDSIYEEVAGYGCTFNISANSSHSVTHTSDGLLSVLVYGFGSHTGYAYLTGMKFQRPDPNEGRGPEIGTIFRSVPFFDLKRFHNTKELERVQDSNSDPIFIPGGMIMGNRKVSTVYVSENGAFSLQEPWKFSHPSRFPTDYFFTQMSDVIAPFWSDNDIRKEGTVRYVAISRGESDEGDEMMDLAVAYLQQNNGVSNAYRGTWMLVAQWDKVHPHPHGVASEQDIQLNPFLNKTNTYQGILLTDRANSYYFFTYICGELEWSSIGSEAAVVGYNAQTDYFFNHPSSGYDIIGYSISCDRGFLSKRQTEQEEATSSGSMPSNLNLAQASQICIALYDQDVQDIPFGKLNREIIEMVEPCPCNSQQAVSDSRFHPDFIRRNCYTQVTPLIISTSSRSYSFVQQCCYDQKTTALYTALPEAGTLLAYDPVSDRQKYEDSEVPFRETCYDSGGGPDLFTERRPTDTCDDYEDPSLSHGTGDPHYRTFDGRYYDFQSNGEYMYLELLSPSGDQVIFQVQGRIGFIPGWSKRVTGHTSVAFGVPGLVAYQFIYEGQFALYKTVGEGSPENIIDMITSSYLPDSSGQFRMRRFGGQAIEVLSSTGIVIDARWYGKYMDLRLEIPGKYRGTNRVRGIFGNFDRDSTNEFAYRSTPSSPLPNINNDRQIFGIIQTWALQNREESMFVYPNEIGQERKKRQSFNDFQNVTVDPIFVDDLNFADEERELCNNDAQCLFDLVVTNDEDLALNTLTVNENVTMAEEILSNFPPNITGPEKFTVELGKKSVYNFTVVDEGDNFTLTVNGSHPERSILLELGDGAYSFQWTVHDEVGSYLSFLATDSAGASSLLVSQLEVCGCVNGGQCTLDGVLDKMAPIVVLNCMCSQAYSGKFCEEDRNGCSEIECFGEVECFDAPAPGVGAMCGSCPDGYTGDGEKCTDIDECTLNSALCDQVCVNTPGRYYCSCNIGYELYNGSNICTDINECDGVGQCQQECSNTEGSYVCECMSGFTLNSDGTSCDADILCGEDNGCSHGCAAINGSEMCYCPLGFTLSANDRKLCIDIDECEQANPCEQICVNTDGSFECSCRVGYELLDDSTCQDKDECFEAAISGLEICFNNTECLNTPGTFHCICTSGYAEMNGICQRRRDLVPPRINQTVPISGANNSYRFIANALTVDQITKQLIQQFRNLTAEAVNEYCVNVVCATSKRNVTGLKVMTEMIAVLSSIVHNERGYPVLSVYVQFNEEEFLLVETLSLAIELAENSYRSAGFLDALRLFFSQNSPVVSGHDMTAYITSNEPVMSLTCKLTGFRFKDCSSGMVHYSNLPTRANNKPYTLKVQGVTDDGRFHIIKRTFRIEEDDLCTAHLINNGVTIDGSHVTIEFAVTGATKATSCILDPPKNEENSFFSCSSPVVMIGLSPGFHRLKIIPKGCDKKYAVKVDFEI